MTHSTQPLHHRYLSYTVGISLLIIAGCTSTTIENRNRGNLEEKAVSKPVSDDELEEILEELGANLSEIEVDKSTLHGLLLGVQDKKNTTGISGRTIQAVLTAVEKMQSDYSELCGTMGLTNHVYIIHEQDEITTIQQRLRFVPGDREKYLPVEGLINLNEIQSILPGCEAVFEYDNDTTQVRIIAGPFKFPPDTAP